MKKIIFPVHPRTKFKLENNEYTDENLLVIPPQGYLDFQSLIFNSKGVLTDSGGIQKRHISGKNRATLRTETEWTETIKTGWNNLVILVKITYWI